MNLYLAGGAVREHMLGRPAKDFDFAVEAESFDAMLAALKERGVDVKQERPEFVCARGLVAAEKLGSFGGLLPRSGVVAADFTLCRAEAMYSDKRHPDVVTPTDLRTDLGRRDFTVNAVAVSEHGQYFDAFGGRTDAVNRVLRTVGPAVDRFTEDPLRMLRAVRFAVTCKLHWDWTANGLRNALLDSHVVDLVATLPHERVREELTKALRYDWRATMLLMLLDAPLLGDAVHRYFPNLWLKATTEER